MKNRKTYELAEINNKFCAAVVGSDPQETTSLYADTDREAALKEIEQMNTTYNLWDYAPEEIEAFWQGIDIMPVNEFFSKLLNLSVKLEKHTGQNYNKQISYALADTTNIATQSAITAAAWSEMNVQSFGCNINVDKATGELYFWATIHLSYKHWGGGSNGAEIGSVTYTKGAWEIESTQERNKDRRG